MENVGLSEHFGEYAEAHVAYTQSRIVDSVETTFREPPDRESPKTRIVAQGNKQQNNHNEGTSGDAVSVLQSMGLETVGVYGDPLTSEASSFGVASKEEVVG